MKYATTPRFDREFEKFPKEVRAAFHKQALFLLQDIHHPSLRAKKYHEGKDIWQARVTGNVRLFFRIEGGVYVLLNIRRHTD